MRRLAVALAFALGPFAAHDAHGQTGEWAWVGGGNGASNQPGIYGTQGVPAPGNLPGGRYDAASETDNSGNLWLFGGNGVTSGNSPLFNDLWEFSPVTSEWTWWSGGSAGAAGVYGTQGVAAAGNVPGARLGAVLWIDQTGNIWLFGGAGNDSAGTVSTLNDLWEFNIATREWTWMGGNRTLPSGITPCQPGVYGTQAVGASANAPGGREHAIGWTGNDGSLWLFGGAGCNSTKTQVLLNDLWRFDPKSGEWTWVSGAAVGAGSGGVYGAVGVPSAANTPGGRWLATSLGTDSSGNFWLFGGIGLDSVASGGDLNDLWEFNPATNLWTWQSGSAALPPSSGEFDISQPGVYGTKGAYAAGNVPGGRFAGTGSIDNKNKLWLFGGTNYNFAGFETYFNDLWSFDPVSKEWAWMSGSDTVACLAYQDGTCVIKGTSGSYGTLRVPAAGNVPGSRSDDISWTDSQGDTWIFGGNGIDSNGNNQIALNDLWKFQPAAGAALSTPVFGTMTFSPVATVAVGTSEAITITDTLSYSGAQPTGAVTYVLNGVSYLARCIPSPGNQNGSPEICTAQVSAATIAALMAASYPTAGTLMPDDNYNSASAPSGIFTVSKAATGCTVPAPTSNTMNIAYFTLAENDADGGTFPNGVSSSYVLPALGTNGLPVFNTAATASSGAIAPPKDLLADGEITWWNATLNNGGPGGTSDVVETGTGVVSLPYANNAFFPPNGTGPDDAHGFQTALLTGNLVAPAPETVSFTIASDDMAFLYLDGQIACDDGGVHAPVSVPCTSSTISAGAHTLQVFYADLNQSGAALDFTVTTSNVGVGAGNQLVFGTMTFSPAATEPQGTSQAITITDTVTYSGVQPTGAVSFTLNRTPYVATCTTAGSPANQETCSAVVPAGTIAALPEAVYTVTGSFAGDCNYAVTQAPNGTFTISQQQVTFGTMTFSPVATVLQGTSQAITISDTLSFSGPQPTGGVTYVLNTVTYPAKCGPSVVVDPPAATPGGSPQTCTAVVPAATIAALPAASYTVTGSFAGDAIYAAAAAANGTFTVTLPPPDFALAAGTLTLVTQHHGKTTISVTPINDFAGTVTLSCGAVPAYVTCEWGPADVAVSGGTASTELTIDTSGILNYLNSTQPSAPPHGSGVGRFALAGLAFPVLLLLGRRRRPAVRLTLCIVALVSMLSLSGCSGKYPDSTKPGTYSITIMGTSGTIQHSTPLTLVVTE